MWPCDNYLSEACALTQRRIYRWLLPGPMHTSTARSLDNVYTAKSYACMSTARSLDNVYAVSLMHACPRHGPCATYTRQSLMHACPRHGPCATYTRLSLMHACPGHGPWKTCIRLSLMHVHGTVPGQGVYGNAKQKRTLGSRRSKMGACNIWDETLSYKQHGRNSMSHVRCEVITVVTIKNAVFWNITPRGLRHQGNRNRRARTKVGSN
jgi:hypothetical protein